MALTPRLFLILSTKAKLPTAIAAPATLASIAQIRKR
jgi:hypothetical protein